MGTLRFPFLFFLVASAAVVGAALGSQYLGGLQPCELCLYERWPYYAAIVLAMLGFAVRGGMVARVAMWLIVLVFVASSCLATYHVGVEQHWIAGPTACTGGIGGASSPDELLKMLQARQPVQCDVVQWSFRGISLAGFNLIASVLLFAVSLAMALRGARE
jgi:disulfide bond formation protein DsbB